MKYFTLIISFFLLFLLSCSQNSTSTEKESFTPDWNDFTINQVYYDSLHVGSHNTIEMNEKIVDKIILFTKEDNQLNSQDTIFPTYASNGDVYYCNFEFILKVSPKIINLEFEVHYHLDLSQPTVITIDTLHSMLNYPYKSTQVFVTADEVFTDFVINFQDIDLSENVLFFHPTGPWGLYEYNFTSKSNRILDDYGSGEYIAHDSIYVFWHSGRIYRYNLLTDTTDLELDLSSLEYFGIYGLECWQGHLYMIFRSKGENPSAGNFIAKFDYDGNLISTIPYPRLTWFLTINNNIAYSVNYYDNTLSVFDLMTGTFLENKLLPANNNEGIRIYKENFYYVDWEKRIIGVFPLSNI